VNARLNRLFAADGRCFDVAVDHGFFGEASFLAGIEDMDRAVTMLVEAGPDAIQLSPGQAPLLQRGRGPKAALVLRADVANVYGREGVGREYLFSELVENVVEKALVLDAACVVVNVLLLPRQPELHHACLRNVSALRAACDPVGMPLMVEPLAMKPGESGYGVDGDADTIVTLVRQAVELGYNRAFRTILDANLTTLISALFLFQFGTGPVKGFAVTLSIGLIANMFTAVLFTRMLFDFMLGRGKVERLSI